MKNKNRQNVFPEGVDFVHSDTLGLTRDRRGKTGLDAYTRERPNVFRFLGARFFNFFDKIVSNIQASSSWGIGLKGRGTKVGALGM